MVSTLVMLCCVLVLFPICAWALETEDFEYKIKGNQVTITKYIGKSGENIDVIVPDMINGYPVTVFGEGGVFPSNNNVLHKIILPDTITEIGESAFRSTNIQEIIMSNNLQTIRAEAFKGSAFTSINLPNSVTSIEYEAFCGSDITSFQMPSSVKKISSDAFNSSKLESIILKEGLESIGASAFRNCKNLKSLQIPSTVTVIGKHAFNNCTLLEAVNIPYGITTIELGSFANCTALKELIIPNSVTTISGSWASEGAFEDCKNLVSLIIPDSVTRIEANAFKGCDSLISLVIPNSVIYLGDIINYCKNLESVVIPSSVVGGDLFRGENCPKMIVYVKSGSYAEEKAKTKSALSVVVDDSVDSIAASVQRPSPSTTTSNPVWKQNEFGWWLENPDGSYLTNTWYQSPDSGLWYYMGADGYMLTNAVTPDGYQVGMDGVWIH